MQFSTLPTLNQLLKGHRRGEFTVVTGATGVGKTTLLSQLSLDLATQVRSPPRHWMHCRMNAQIAVLRDREFAPCGARLKFRQVD